ALVPLSLLSLGVHPHLHSFPTRRSSDLAGLAADYRQCRGALRGEDVPDQQRQRGRQRPFLRQHLADLVGGFLAALDRIDGAERGDRKSTRLNSSHVSISYAVFCLNKKNA